MNCENCSCKFQAFLGTTCWKNSKLIRVCSENCAKIITDRPTLPPTSIIECWCCGGTYVAPTYTTWVNGTGYPICSQSCKDDLLSGRKKPTNPHSKKKDRITMKCVEFYLNILAIDGKFQISTSPTDTKFKPATYQEILTILNTARRKKLILTTVGGKEFSYDEAKDIPLAISEHNFISISIKDFKPEWIDDDGSTSIGVIEDSMPNSPSARKKRFEINAFRWEYCD